jgi:hypothetical protein
MKNDDFQKMNYLQILYEYFLYELIDCQTFLPTFFVLNYYLDLFHWIFTFFIFIFKNHPKFALVSVLSC